MKKQKIKGIGYIGAAVVVLFAGFFTASFGAVTLGVQYTKHNLGSTNVLGGDFRAVNESEVCVFCHTPHNTAAVKTFLWNRNGVNDASTFTMYSSATLTSAAGGAVISEVSKMCMSCHDGVTALNSMANPRSIDWNSFGTIDLHLGDVYDGGMLGWGPNIGEGIPTVTPGTDLSNDHPISFSYTDAQVQDTQTQATSGLNAIDIPISKGLVFWGPNSDQIECVTCHDPHINYNPGAAFGNGDASLKPFLRMSNASSNLCFACHNK